MLFIANSLQMPLYHPCDFLTALGRRYTWKSHSCYSLAWESRAGRRRAGGWWAASPQALQWPMHHRLVYVDAFSSQFFFRIGGSVSTTCLLLEKQRLDRKLLLTSKDMSSLKCKCSLIALRIRRSKPLRTLPQLRWHWALAWLSRDIWEAVGQEGYCGPSPNPEWACAHYNCITREGFCCESEKNPFQSLAR